MGGRGRRWRLRSCVEAIQEVGSSLRTWFIYDFNGTINNNRDLKDFSLKSRK